MRILITGGAGFIGSHLADRLLAEDHEVIAMDNLATGSMANIAHLLDHLRFQFIHHDVARYIAVDGPLDAILHLASLPSPVDYLQKPIQTLKVGSLGTHNALGLALAKKARFLLASTSEVYGDPLVHPQPESYWGNVNPVGPRGVYDESKRFAEALTMAYHRAHGVSTRIARIFNTYGPRMRLDDGRVVPNFIRQALLQEPLTVYDDGSRTRSFCIHADECIPIVGPDGILEIRRIGEYIESLLGDAHDAQSIESYSIPCLDIGNSHVQIGRISHISRRRTRERMLRIRLRWGMQYLRVTENHPLLVWRHGAWKQERAGDIVVGDMLPTALTCPKPDREIDRLDLVHEFTATLPPDVLAGIFVRDLGAVFDLARQRTGSSIAQIHSDLQLPTSYEQVIHRKSMALPDFVRFAAHLGLEGPFPDLRLGTMGCRFYLPGELHLTPAFMRLLGYFVAEGNYNAGSGYHLVLTNKDTRILSDIKQILTDLGVHYLDSICTSGTPQVTVVSRMLYLLFRDVFRIGEREKRIPRGLFNMPVALIREFLCGYLSGDGWVAEDRTRSSFRIGLTSYSPMLLREMAFLFAMLGLPGSTSRAQFHIGGRELIESFSRQLAFVQEEKNALIQGYLRRVRRKGGGNRLLKDRREGVALNRVISIQEVPCSEYVYDLQVEPYRSFAICTSGMTFVHNCYVSDLVDGLYRLLRSDYHWPVNLGNPHEMTILEFSQRILAATGSPSPITFIVPTDERTRDDPSVRQPDITLARSLLGWEPRVPLEEGLARTIPWFRQKLEKEGRL
jgi:dTDP-glucose 4,6-dehydratase